MSAQERLKNRGRLEEEREKAAKLKLKIEGLRDSLRNNLDEFEKIEDLKLSHVVGDAVEAAADQVEYKRILATIAAIEKALS